MKFFSNKRKIKFRQKVGFILGVIMLLETVYPSAAMALTSGPSAPEFSSFEPVATTSMVDEFSGDFTYNIPVINIPGASGGGYAMSLSYHSGETVESEASWVGYGWTLNPGSINRGKRGFADDTKNTYRHFNKVPRNWTVSTGASIGNLELFSFGIPVSANASIRYNNYRGFGYTAGAGLSFRQGLVSLGYSVSDGSGSFSAQVSPAALLHSKKKKATKEEIANQPYKKADKAGKKAMQKAHRTVKKDERKKMKNSEVAKQTLGRAGMGELHALGGAASSYGMYALSDQQHPTSITPYDGFSFNTTFSLQLNPSPLEIGPQIGFFGNFNYQTNKEDVSRTGYGYLYSQDAYNDAVGVMDYYLEKDGTFDKRDRYMSIPFSNADMFSVSGEGLGGGFRLHSRKSGYFRPNSIESKTIIGQLAGDICLGLEFGGGVTLGLGQQTLTSGESWGSSAGFQQTYRFPNSTDSNEPYFFRFNNDLGGNVEYDPSNDLVKADISVDSWTPGFKTAHPSLGVNSGLLSTIDLDNSSVNRSGRSSYIGYHTNDEINYTVNNNGHNVRVKAYEKDITHDIAYRSEGSQIGEIATVNEDGNTYVYGLPVYVANETNLQYDLDGVSAANIHNNFIAYNSLSGNKMKIGEVDEGKYASSYLLTQITSPDFVDRNLDGPDPDDFGGYTKFKYKKVWDATGSTGYHYRMPYTGLNYMNNELTDPSDDMGSYSSGDRDVDYLEYVETKTHIAKFFTSDREDGIDAAGDGAAASSPTAKGAKKLKKLDKIELYARDENGAPGKLIKTVMFKYDYSLCGSTPNNSNAVVNQMVNGVMTNVNANRGKLTLKEVWFEYEGVVTAKISPYKFKYNYPKNTTAPVGAAVPYPAKYQAFQDQYGDKTNGLNENPAYNYFAVDAWGNYQDAARGGNRFDKMKIGVSQRTPSNDNTDPNTDYAPPLDFDPAAWQLKVIQLPSGGEIHVQYEQDDYLYVQDRRAEALVSLVGTDPVGQQGSVSTYELNVSDIGLTTLQEKNELADLINQRYNNDKIYFKFLYALVGTDPDLGKCSSDYIDGYVNFNDAYVDQATEKIYINLDAAGSYSLPRDICLDIVKKQKGGKLNPSGNCDASASGVDDQLAVKDLVMQLLSKIGTSFFAQGTSCLQIKPNLSYFKIPVLKPKKGGGLRVKRIMMYDANGIDTEEESLYGTEYFYQTEDGKSSGVCTNEPGSIRDENALITFLPKRREQNFAEKVIGGVDREQFEGPIGESLLPSSSVGYSNVVAKNIHSGKTNTGFVVSNFYTVKDYPFDMSYNGTEAISSTDVAEEKDWMNLPAIVFNYGVTNVFASQGYRFILNSMHGQPRSVSTYAGDFVGGELKYYAQSSSTDYQYFQPGEEISVMKPNGDIDEHCHPGKEMEMTFEIKSIEDVTEDASIEVDFGVGIAGIIPLPQASLSPLVNYTESKLRTHVTSKVIRYPVIQKAVISTQDGIVHKTENLVFSSYTGKPVKTRTTDGYAGLDLPSDNGHNGNYTSYSTPAYSQYKEMGQKAINERLEILPGQPNTPWTDITISYSNAAGSHTLNFAAAPGHSVCDAMEGLAKGDLIRINGGSTAYFHVDELIGSSVTILPATLINSSPSVSNSSVSSIEIIRSGRTNQLNTMAGGYTTYGAEQNPIVTSSIPANILSARQQFALWLNGILGTSGTYTCPVNAQYTDASGNCVSLEGKTIKIVNNGTNVTVSVMTSSGQPIPVPLDSHPLVIDLNNYINKIWGLNLNNSTNFSAFPSSSAFAGSGCTNPYYDYYSLNNPTLRTQINSYSGATTMLSNQYNINGVPTPGSNFLTFSNYSVQNVGAVIDVPHQKALNNVEYLMILPPTGTYRFACEYFTQGQQPCASANSYSSIHVGLYGNLSTGGNVVCDRQYDNSDPRVNDQALFNFIYSNPTFTSTLGKFHNDAQGWLWFEGIECPGYIKKIMKLTEPTLTPPQYCDMTLPYSGSFSVNTTNGQLEYYKGDNPCHPYPVDCIKFCPDVQEIKGVPNVIASSATTFDCNWSYDPLIYPGSSVGNVYETGMKGKWRPKSSFVYNEAIVGGAKTANNERNYKNAGIYVMEKFNWKNPASNNPDKWVKASTVTKYSPNGEAMEEVDALGIYSAAKFGYKGTVPYLVAQNANSGSVVFESFEKVYGNNVEDGLPISIFKRFGASAHSGKWSYKLNSGGELAFNPMLLSNQLFDKGMGIKVWVKEASRAALPIKGMINTTPFSFEKIAQTGEWTLYEAKITNWGALAVNGTFITKIQSNISSTANLFIDDVRIQPLNAQMNAYVYDPATLRLLTSFDDQHFGLYYQYNAEGKLVRKMIETEKGLKTITETQYNTPTGPRP